MGEALITRRGGSSDLALNVWQDNGNWDLLFTGSAKTVYHDSEDDTVSLWTAPINFDDYSCLKAEVSFGAYSMTTGNSAGSNHGPFLKLSDFGGRNINLGSSQTYMPTQYSISVDATTRYVYIYKLGHYYESSEDTQSFRSTYTALRDGTEASVTTVAKTLFLSPVTSNLNIVGGFRLLSGTATACEISIKIYGQR